MSDVLATGTVFANEWRVLKLLHAGAISHVYEVEQTSTGAKRALKVVHASVGIDPKFRELFLEEARRAAKVKSEHVAEVLTCGIDTVSDRPYAALELLEGKSLATYVTDRSATAGGGLPVGEVLNLVTQLGHALSAAHDVGVVHRDLKPEGIILAEVFGTPAPGHAAVPYRVEVQFVGAGKVASEALHNTTAAMGRPLWMSPEQSETDAKLTPATDMWPLALLTFWMLTGRHYWKTGRDMGSAAMTLLREVLYEPLVSSSERAEELGVSGLLPPGFDAWFGRCVVREPEHRFQHAREALAALTPILQAVAPPMVAPGPVAPVAVAAPQLPPPNLAAGPMYKASAPRRTTSQAPPGASSGSNKSLRIVGVIAAALLMLGFIGGGGFWLYQQQQEKDRKAAAAKADKEREEEREAEREAERKKRDALKNWSDEESPVPISAKDPMWGRREAPVTIVVFTDLECPFCSKLETTLDELKASHGQEKLRIVYKHHPLTMLHKNARAAHEIAEAVFVAKGSEAFLKLKEKAFRNRELLGGDEPIEWAKELGVTRADVTKARDDAGKKIDADLELGKKLGIRGTPHTFVNGIPMTGAQATSKFDEVIRSELEKAKAEATKGTLPDKIYVARSKENFAAPPAADPDTKPAADDSVWSVPIGDSPVQGPKSAKVTIVSFSEYECPYCSKVQPTLKQIRNEYGDRVRFVWKDNPLPFHKRAEPSAQFAREIRAQKGDDAFWRAHDLLFENQQALADDDLKVYAFRLGADPIKVMAAVSQRKHKAGIEADQKLSTDLEATGTPTFFINGRKLTGAQPFEKFKEVIDREEGVATAAMTAKNLSADAYYDEIVRTGKSASLEVKTPGPIPASAPRRGSKTPKVVVQWFSDLECPFCARSSPMIEEVLKDHGDQVQVVWRHLPLPFHSNARLAAMAGEEVRTQLGDEVFFKFVDAAFERKRSGDLDRFGLEMAALDASRGSPKALSVGGFRNALDGNRHEARIKEDEDEAKRLGIKGTPGFLVGKYYLAGAVPASKMKATIEKALKEAP